MTRERAIKLLEKDLEKRTKAGKPLTAESRRLLLSLSSPRATDGCVRSWSALAKALQVERTTLRNRSKEPGAPYVNGHNLYNVAEWRAFLDSRDPSTNLPAQTEARAKLMDAQREKIELAMAIKRGEYLPAKEVEQKLVGMALAVRRAVERLELLAPQIVGMNTIEAKQLLRVTADKILDALSNDPFAQRSN